MQDNIVLKTTQLSKQYKGMYALESLDLLIPRGAVFGLLGPNGSGKTTTLALLLDIIKPSSGTFEWFGSTHRPDYIYKIGALLETPNFYPYLNGKKNLEIVAQIKGVNPSKISEVLDWVGLTGHENKSFKQYSLGMKQRLAIGAALLADPEVLILDEPTNGLDPAGIAQIRKLIQEISQKGTTILLASHLLDEVEKVCTHYAVLERGKLLRIDTLEKDQSEGLMAELMADDPQLLQSALAQSPIIQEYYENENFLYAQLHSGHSMADLNRALFEKGIACSHLKAHHKSLEKKFFDLTNKK